MNKLGSYVRNQKFVKIYSSIYSHDKTKTQPPDKQGPDKSVPIHSLTTPLPQFVLSCLTIEGEMVQQQCSPPCMSEDIWPNPK